jgi:uncharacterized repeat protein (TIGR02543 family)
MRQSSSSEVSPTTGTRRKVKTMLHSFFTIFFVTALACMALPQSAFANSVPMFNSVTFYQNDSPTDQTDAGQTANEPTDLTSFASISPSFVNPGYVFSDWSTSATVVVGSEIYTNGALYDFASNMPLYAQWTPDIYAVTFIASGGTVTPSSANYTVGTLPLTLLAPTFTGYLFAGWNTAANGSGATYAAGAQYTPVADVTLYAQWTPATYSLVFNVEGGAVAPASVNFTFGTVPLTLPTPTFLGHAFTDWNTVSNGLGTSYAAGASISPVTNMTLYAQWTSDIFTLTYNAGGGTVSPVSANFTVGSNPLALVTPLFAGHVFGGWNTVADGTGTSYPGGASFTPAANETLYAQWTAAAATPTSTIVFVSNGAVGTIAPVTASNGTSITLPNADALTYSGFTFAGWNISAQGDGANYASASNIVLASSLTLYAQWTQLPVDTISFAGNGGVGSVTSLSVPNGTSMTLPGGIGLSYAGHTFASWNTQANGAGTVLNVGGSLEPSTSLTLYAQWDALLVTKSPSVLIGAVGSFGANSSKLTASLKVQVMRLALLTRAGHFTAETLYGYANDPGSASSRMAVSNRRANAVAGFLRAELAVLRVKGVKVTSAGEGSFVIGSGPTFRRVEVFVKS